LYKLVISSLFLLFLSSFLCVKAEKNDAAIQYDSSELILYSPDTSFINSFRGQKELNYQVDNAPEGIGWKELVFLKLMEIVSTIFSNEGIVPYVRYLVFILIFLGLLFHLFGGKFQALYSSQGSPLPQWSESPLDSLPGALDEQIALEINAGQFRNAIRLMYIQVLLNFEKNKLIIVRKEKTGRNYIDELAGKEVQPVFKLINKSFEFVWYGDFNPDRKTFDTIQEQFIELSKLLK
jgi:hypothetical protein